MNETPHEKITADQIAEIRSRGDDVSRFFTNEFVGVHPTGEGEEQEC